MTTTDPRDAEIERLRSERDGLARQLAEARAALTFIAKPQYGLDMMDETQDRGLYWIGIALEYRTVAAAALRDVPQGETLPAYESGFLACRDAAVAQVNRAREEGETDLRQVRSWINALDPAPQGQREGK